MAHLTNMNEEEFTGGNNAAGAVTVTHAVLGWDLTDDANRKVIWNGSLATSRSYVAGDPITLPAGALDITFPAGSQGVEDDFIKDALDAIWADQGDDAQLALGTAAITFTGGTINNEVADANYVRQTVEITRGTGDAP